MWKVWRKRAAAMSASALKPAWEATSTSFYCPSLLLARDWERNRLYAIRAKVEDIIMFVNIITLVKVHFFTMSGSDITRLSKQPPAEFFFKADIYLTSAALRWFISASLGSMSGLVMYLLNCNGNTLSGGTRHWQSMKLIWTMHNTKLSHYNLWAAYFASSILKKV